MASSSRPIASSPECSSLRRGTRSFDWDSIISMIAEGRMRRLKEAHYGNIYLHTQEGNSYAVKMLSNTEKLEKFIQRATTLPLAIHHPHIVETYASHHTEGSTYILMEYVDGVNLDTFFRLAAERDIEINIKVKRHLIYQIASALDYFHKHSFSHRDIKPENILIDSQGRVRIVDLDYITQAERCETVCGTLTYVAPEIAEGLHPLNKKVYYSGLSADLWSFGCLITSIILHKPPFGKLEDLSQASLITRILYTIPKIELRELKRVDPKVVELVEKLLTKDPKVRLSYFENGFESILQDPFLQDVATAKDSEKENQNLSQIAADNMKYVQDKVKTAFSDF